MHTCSQSNSFTLQAALRTLSVNYVRFAILDLDNMLLTFLLPMFMSFVSHATIREVNSDYCLRAQWRICWDGERYDMTEA